MIRILARRPPAHLPESRTMHVVVLAALAASAGVTRGAEALETIPQPYRSEASGLPVVPFGVGTGARRGEGGATLVPPLHWDVLTQDITLARTLERWAAQAGYRVKWDAQRNFLIGAPDSYEGTFEAALQTVLGSPGIRQSDYPLEACIYANSPPLVRITRLGEQARECAAQ